MFLAKLIIAAITPVSDYPFPLKMAVHFPNSFLEKRFGVFLVKDSEIGLKANVLTEETECFVTDMMKGAPPRILIRALR